MCLHEVLTVSLCAQARLRSGRQGEPHSGCRLRILLLFLCFAGVGQVLRAATFTNPYRLPTTSDPVIIVSGDLNGDGVLDFVWTPANAAGGQFNVYLSQPGGGWLPGASFAFPANSSISSCALVDVNLDKKMDLVCSGSDLFTAYVHVFLGNGDGTFQSPATTVVPLPSTGSYPGVILANEGDLNGDGVPDFFYEDRVSSGGYILLGDGNGGFQPPIALASSSANDVIPVSADVNGDGIPDLLYPIGPAVALGKGDGTFGPIVEYAAESYYLASCIFHDMEGNGHVDAVCGYPESIGGDITGATDLIVLHGNPDGSFNTTPISQTRFGDYDTEYDGFGTFFEPLYVADVNGDGTLDVLGYSNDGLAVLFGGPNLTFSRPLHYAVGLIQPLIYGALSLNQGQIVDVNGDGRPDVVATGPHGIYIAYGKPDGSFVAAFAPEVAEVIGYPTVADFNGDGIPDIAATGDTAIKLSLGKGDGTFSSPAALGNQNGAVNFSTPLSATNAHIVHGDFNGDGKIDLMAIGSYAIYNYQSYILWGNGDGTFQEPLAVPNSTVVYPMYEGLVDPAVYDINGDRRSDLVANSSTSVGSPSDLIVSNLSNGDGTFTAVATVVPQDANSGITLPALADFNGDGKLDAAYGSLNHVYIVKGHGDGSFDTVATALPIPNISGQASLGSIAVATADIDGDGNQDITVLVQYGTGQYPYPSQLATAAWAYYGNGNGTFSSPVLIGQFDRNYTGIAAADLDRNGRADVVVKTSGSLGGGYAVGICSSLPSRTFGPEVNYFAGTGLSNLEIADVNHDGWPDLVFGNGDFNLRASSVTVLLNQEAVPQVSGVLTAVPEPSATGQPFNLIAALTPPSPATLTGSVIFTIDGNNVGSAPLVNNSATLNITAVLTVGTHSVGAIWPGDATYSSVTLSGTHIVIANPTSTSLTSSFNPANIGQSVTFAATVTSSNGIPTGSVVFTDGATALSTANLVNGAASLSTSSMTVGSHNITATYTPAGAFAGSSASLTEIIDAAPSATTLTSTANPAYALQPVTLNAQVTSSTAGTLTGSVTFLDGAATLGSAPLTANGTAALTVSFAASGSHSLTAMYGGDANFNGSTSRVLTEVVLINTSATVLQAPGTAGAFVPVTLNVGVTSATAAQYAPGVVPAGTVTFYDGAAILGTATLSASGTAGITVSTFQVGTHFLTAVYGGNVSFQSSTSAPSSLGVTPDATTTTLTGAPNPAAVGTTVIFNVTVASAATPVAPAGSVTIYDGTNALGQVGLNAQGQASFSTSVLTIGTHSISASYSGDLNFTPSSSGEIQETISPFLGSFTFTVAPGSITLYTGQAGHATATAIAQGGFNYSLSLSCAGLPAGATCQFQPSTIAGGAGSAALVIQTSAPEKEAWLGPSPFRGLKRSGAAGALACVVLLFLPRRRRRWWLMAMLVAWTATAVTACGGKGNLTGGTPPGTYAITVTAQATNAGQQVAQSSVITLNVKSLF